MSLLSVGCDIVDLDALGPALHPRYAERVLVPSERVALEHLPKDRLWWFWAAKEAAFKALSRGDSDQIFSPKEFVYSVDSGKVTVGSVVIPVRVEECERTVRAIAQWPAAESALSELHEGVVRFSSRETPEQDQSEVLRRFAAERIATWFGWGGASVEVRRNVNSRRRWPVVYRNGQAVEMPISLSHDGDWGMVVLIR